MVKTLVNKQNEALSHFGLSSARMKWRLIRPFLFLSILLVLLMGGLAFWSFDLGRDLGAFFLYFIPASAAGVFIAVFYSLSVSKRFVAPLHQMTASVEKASKGTFEHPVRLESDIFQPLEERFNEMAERLESRIQFLSDDRLKVLSILSDMVEGVLVLDALGRIVLVNPAFEKLFGQSRKEMIGGYHYEKLRHHSLNALVDAVIESGEPRACEIGLEIPQRQVLEVQASVAQPFEHGSVVLVFHDITQKKRHEEIQADFVANISHELRTPISIIKGYIETLIDGGIADQEQTVAFLEILQKNSTRMERIVEDLLQLSRIESGLDPARPVEMPLLEALERTVVLFKPLAEKKKQTLSLVVPPDLKILADPEKLNLAMTNLLDNAIKYTGASGEIRILAKEEPDAVILEIEDNGIGIPNRDLIRIFERFYRVDRTRSRQLGGTGLGLSIVKKIVEAHGGQISVESKAEKGSRFRLAFFKHPEA